MSLQSFVQASRQKLRFQTTKGILSVEQLWDLPLTSTTGAVNLDSIAVEVFSKLENAPVTSFVRTAPVLTKDQQDDALRLEILKYIIAVKQEENALKLQQSAKAEEKRKLLELLAKKQEASMDNLSEEEVRKRLAELGA
jgi:hypothetical protein